MGTVLYKKLVEIHILHDYYLAASDESSFFDITDADDRLARLNDLLARSRYDIRKDLRIVPTETTRKQLENHRIRFITTATGFFLAAEVRQLPVGGVDRYQMAIPVSDNPNWEFILQAVNPHFSNFTNDIGVGEFSSGYFLTNNNPDSNKVYPSLSLPVEPFNMGDTYEMGSLSIISGDLRQAQKQTASASSGWVVMPNDHHWVNASDRHLLPTRFRYTLTNPGISESTFDLSDLSGTTVTSLSTTDAGVISLRDESDHILEVIVDFTTFNVGVDDITLEQGSYLLEVSEDGTLTHSFNVHFYNDLAPGFGGLLLNPRTGDPDFALLEDIGSNRGLLMRRPDGSHPQFEIRLMNRITYWRYYSITASELEPKNKATLFLEPVAGGPNLTTKEPKPLQQEPLLFVDGADQIYLPNPRNARIKPDVDGKLYSDIFMSEIKDLIENK